MLKKLSFFFTIPVLVFLTSCHRDKTESDAVSSKQSHEASPAVAIAPVIDNSESGLGWSLSDELTYSLSSRLVQKTKLSIANPQQTGAQLKKAKSIGNPFGNELQWIKTTFPGEDFVVFMELIEHREKLRESKIQAAPETLPAELDLSLRLRIVDLRGQKPKVILQEILQDSHFIPRQFTSYNFQQSPWNSEDFTLSPIGIAHALLIKELCARIEDYVLLARERD